VLLSDTVGFIRDLPHSLIASFKATLEEARQADLLLHVADAANPAVLDQISAVYGVLQELGIEEKDTLLVLNQIDRLDDHRQIGPVLKRYPNAIPISARTREGLDRLHEAVSGALSRSFADLDVETSAANGKLLAYLAAHGEVLTREFQDDRVKVHVRIPQRHVGPLNQEDTTFHPHVYSVETETALPVVDPPAQDVA
jgi:GTP-binding protein HflX